MTEAADLQNHPATNPETMPYWEAAAAGKLLIKQCLDCGRPHFYPRSTCPHCRSTNTEWKEASGDGEIYSYAVMRRTDPQFAVAYVALAEGVTMFTNVVDCDLDAIRIGDKVKVSFAKSGDGLVRPVFTPGG